MANITAPVEGFTGKVIGVAFADGKAETKDDAQIAYFVRHGYTVDKGKPAKSAAGKEAEAKAKADADAKRVADEAAKAEADRLAAEAKEAADKAASDDAKK